MFLPREERCGATWDVNGTMRSDNSLSYLCKKVPPPPLTRSNVIGLRIQNLIRTAVLQVCSNYRAAPSHSLFTLTVSLAFSRRGSAERNVSSVAQPQLGLTMNTNAYVPRYCHRVKIRTANRSVWSVRARGFFLFDRNSLPIYFPLVSFSALFYFIFYERRVPYFLLIYLSQTFHLRPYIYFSYAFVRLLSSLERQ